MNARTDLPSVERIRGLAENLMRWPDSNIGAACDLLRTIAAHLESGAKGREGEAVAWRYRYFKENGEPHGWHYVEKEPTHTSTKICPTEIESLYTSPQPSAVVTEEMVERGIRSMRPRAAIFKDDRDRMRAALEAALRPMDAWEDPDGFDADMVNDEANNYTRRETGKQMLLNYAAFLTVQGKRPDSQKEHHNG
jgi:hypothetical protein